ncbi:glycosyltransferase, partial [Azospirillum sp. YIM DDC1]
WQEKRRAIQHAAAHVMISHNSARDLERLYPGVAAGSTAVAHCGVGEAFRPAEAAEIAAFRKAHGLERPYLLMVGDRAGYQGYKNGLLLFRALGLGDPATRDLTVLCVGGAKEIEPAFRALAPDVPVVRLSMSDEELRLAYAGAEALAYPSRYEGFGMPVVEAMACGCPVITCANSSLIEVAGDAALFAGEDDAAGMAAAIAAARDPARRAGLVARGLDQASHFTFNAMAAVMAEALTDAAARLADGRAQRPLPVWQELRVTQAAGGGSSGAEEDEESPWVLRRRLQRSEQHLRAVQNELTSMQNSPFWRLRGITLGMLRRLGVRWRR